MLSVFGGASERFLTVPRSRTHFTATGTLRACKKVPARATPTRIKTGLALWTKSIRADYGIKTDTKGPFV